MNKHLKLFVNHSAYNAAEPNLDRPNVSLCVQQDEVHYNPYVESLYWKYQNGQHRDYLVNRDGEVITIQHPQYGVFGLKRNIPNYIINIGSDYDNTWGTDTVENFIMTSEIEGSFTYNGVTYEVVLGTNSENLGSITPNPLPYPMGDPVIATFNGSTCQILGSECISHQASRSVAYEIEIDNEKMPYSIFSELDEEEGEYTFSTSGQHIVKFYPTLNHINSYEFKDCINLTNISIPNNITLLATESFKNCSALTSVIIPSSITEIQNGVFINCTSLNSITVLATTPPTMIEWGAFNNTNDCPIYVPSASVDTYKAATGWSDYANRIQAIQ